MNPFLCGDAYIDGVWIAPQAEASIPVINPFNGDVIAHCPHLSMESIHEAIEAGHRAFASWSQVPAPQRGEILLRWYDEIMAHVDVLAKVVTLENGKPLAESKAEVRYTASFVLWFAQEARRIYGKEIPSNHSGQRLLARKEPVGVCGIITPWNFPSAMLGRKLAAALAAGCTVVAKPSEETPLSACALVRLAEKAGVPAGVINLVTGNPADIGALLCSSPKISKISFTGSTRVGRLLMQQSAYRLHRLSLELGGNAPFVVCADANIEQAAQGLMNSKFRNCGQTCIASNRVLVHQSQQDALLQVLLPKIQDIRLGDGLDQTTTLGPMINIRAVQKVRDLVKDALDKGAGILLGTVPSGDRFIEPIVLVGVQAHMKLWSTEIFGPVIAMRTFEDDEEAIELANDTEYGLAAYVFTEGQKRSWRYSEQLRFGMVGINTGKISTAQAPFGGVKQSGFGREGSWLGLDEYLSIKYVCVQ